MSYFHETAAWFKGLDVYGWFLFVVFGIPAIIAGFLGLGIGAIALVEHNGWATVPIMLIYPTAVLAITMGFMGAMTDTTAEVFPREWSGAKKFCVFWWTTSGLAIIALGIPGLVVYGIRGLIA